MTPIVGHRCSSESTAQSDKCSNYNVQVPGPEENFQYNGGHMGQSALLGNPCKYSYSVRPAQITSIYRRLSWAWSHRVIRESVHVKTMRKGCVNTKVNMESEQNVKVIARTISPLPVSPSQRHYFHSRTSGGFKLAGPVSFKCIHCPIFVHVSSSAWCELPEFKVFPRTKIIHGLVRFSELISIIQAAEKQSQEQFHCVCKNRSTVVSKGFRIIHNRFAKKTHARDIELLSCIWTKSISRNIST